MQNVILVHLIDGQKNRKTVSNLNWNVGKIFISRHEEICASQKQKLLLFFFPKLNELSLMENITHILLGFLKYGVTENFSRAGEFCFHKQTMNSSCLYACLVQITSNNKTSKRKKHDQK